MDACEILQLCSKNKITIAITITVIILLFVTLFGLIYITNIQFALEKSGTGYMVKDVSEEKLNVSKAGIVIVWISLVLSILVSIFFTVKGYISMYN